MIFITKIFNCIIIRNKISQCSQNFKFKQSDWLNKHIDFNTDQRKNAANSFEKEFFKLMNDNTFGETMENLRKRINVRLDNNVDDNKKIYK